MGHPSYQRRFGRRVRVLRDRRELTQEQLGQECNPVMDRGSVSAIEAGIRNVELHTVYKLAKALKCKMAELMPDFE